MIANKIALPVWTPGKIRKRIGILCFAALLSSSGLVAQNLMDSMSIEKVIGNKAAALKFIDTELISYDISLNEKINLNHPLLLFLFNKIKVQSKTENLIFGLPVNGVFAYKKDPDSFCIYLLMELSRPDLGVIAEKIGYADNITPEDYKNGDFDFLAWRLQDMEALLINDTISKSGQQGKQSFIMCLTNMKMKDIVSPERIFK